MCRIQNVMEENEKLKTKIKEREGEILQLRKTSKENDVNLSKDLNMIEKEIETFVDTKKEAEQEIQRLKIVIENCDQNISNMKRDQEAKEDQAQRENSSLKADDLMI